MLDLGQKYSFSSILQFFVLLFKKNSVVDTLDLFNLDS